MAIAGDTVPVDVAARAEFRALCRGDDLALTVATGDDRHYVNMLLAVGTVSPRLP